MESRVNEPDSLVRAINLWDARTFERLHGSVRISWGRCFNLTWDHLFRKSDQRTVTGTTLVLVLTHPRLHASITFYIQ
jgi:hypothetical protein